MKHNRIVDFDELFLCCIDLYRQSCVLPVEITFEYVDLKGQSLASRLGCLPTKGVPIDVLEESVLLDFLDA